MNSSTRRSREKVLHSKSNFVQMEQSQSQDGSTSQSDPEDSQDNNDVQFHRFSSPTFNIHIHVPQYDSSCSKIYLPKIQPVINLHFDEFARRLESDRTVQSEKYFYKAFQDMIKKVSPKFGNVNFHYKRGSEQRDIESSNTNNVTPNCSQRHKDIRLNQKINSKKSQNVVTKTKKMIFDSNNENNDCNEVSESSSNINNCNNSAPTSHEVDKDIKLKKAVVVLTDVRKTKNYKHFLEKSGSCKHQSNDNESSSQLENSYNLQNYEADIHSLNAKNEYCTSESLNIEKNNNGLNISENLCTDNDIYHQTENHVNDEADIKKINTGKQNFTSLVDGWSFSDILNRFQVKYSEKLGKCDANSNCIVENGSNNDGKEGIKLNHDSIEEIKENICAENEKNDFENESENDNKSCREIKESEIDLNESDNCDENQSDTTESFSYEQYQNETVNDFLKSELDVHSQDSPKKSKTKSKGIKPKFVSDLVYSDSDECESNSGKEVKLNNIMDGEKKTGDLSSAGSSAIQRNTPEVLETKKSSSLDVTNPNFHLKLIKKEMKRRSLCSSTPVKVQENLKSEKPDVMSPPSESTSSPKKMKLSNTKPEVTQRRKKQSSQSEDFIRLNSSGSTEFYVTSLNKVSPLKCEAKDFKQKMLFGDRVNRFSRSDHLRVYKLKQEAAVKGRNSKNY